LTDGPPKTAIFTAWLAILLVAGLLILGFILHGTSAASLKQLWMNILAEPRGPFAFRFILQPVLAAGAALRDGINGARAGRSPFLWAIACGIEAPGGLLWEAIRSTAKVVIAAVAMDGVYQWLVLDAFYPREAVAIALLLGFIPYLLLRGPIRRVARRWVG
jgi:hypothetical protein